MDPEQRTSVGMGSEPPGTPRLTPLQLVDPADALLNQRDAGSLPQVGVPSGPPPPGPPPPGGAVTLVKNFDEYKLETEFYDGYVVHTTYEWNRLSSSKSKKTSKWKKKAKIGSGSFGVIHLQEEEEEEGGEKEKGGVEGQSGQLRAVKTLPRGTLLEANESQELLALVKLNRYEHLFVKFLGWYEDMDYIFLAMEYIEHGDLGQYTKNLRPITEVKEITRQILEGLEVLHYKEIYHRDLKPQNILIASLDPIWVKIADFGVSKRAKNTILRTRVGTQGYLAPELLGILPRKWKKKYIVPHALDIWSLGSLVHQLLTSKTPFMDTNLDGLDSETGIMSGLSFEGETDIESLQEYCHGDIEFPADILKQSQVDEEGIAFIQSLLVPNPIHRPTASYVLQNPWLIGYTSAWTVSLKDEFSRLGVALKSKESAFMRQIGKQDITRFLPDPAKENILSLLLEAIFKGYNLAISMLLESSVCSLDSIDEPTRGKLFQKAVEGRNFWTMKQLLERTFEVGACIGDKAVLGWTVEEGYIDAVKVYLENTANVKTNSICIESFLLAIRLGDVGMVEAFLNSKVDINTPNGGGQTVLQAIAECGNLEIVKLLLISKAKTQAISKIQAVLQWAITAGKVGIVKLLLENDTDVTAIEDCEEAFRFAIKSGDSNMIRVFVGKVDISAPIGYGQTPLGIAARSGHKDSFKTLLDSGANIGASCGDDEVLKFATMEGHINVVKVYLKNTANIRNNKGAKEALVLAAMAGHIDLVRCFLGSKINPNSSNRDGQTALEAAAKGGHIDIVRLLLERKARVNTLTPRRDGRTAIQAAAEGGHIDIVRLLLDNNANINALPARWSGRTALQAAAGGGHIDIVRLLLENNANINASPAKDYGVTALQAAAGGGYIDIVRLLLDNNADINASPARSFGRTALEAAAEDGHIDIVRLLLDNNADINALPAEIFDVTNLKAATRGSNGNITKLLLEKKSQKIFLMANHMG